MNKKLIIIILSLFFAGTFNINAQVVYKAPQKKLMEFGWNSPSLSQYKERMNNYENGPFDGITLKISKEAGNGNVFMVKDWVNVSATTRENEKKLASSVAKSKVLTDNFLVLYGASQMDWFSDKDWAVVEDHLKFAARLAKESKCIGILWDPEPYKPGKNPWKYREQDKSAEFTLEQYYKQIRKRGAQFMTTLQNEFPDLIILSLRELSDWQKGSPFSGALLPVSDRETTLKELEEAWWGLHPAFYSGMLDAIQPGTEFIDANEDAYYYTSSLEYYKIRNTLTDDAKSMIPPELWSKHYSFNRIGHAVSADYIAGNWLGISPFPYRLSGQGLMMTSFQRAKWFEHNSYYALRTSDKYAWLYTEDMNWWTGERVPEGFREALIRAKNKVNSGQVLGFEIEPLIKIAQDEAEVYYRDKQKQITK